jgi:hypothetical protein
MMIWWHVLANLANWRMLFYTCNFLYAYVMGWVLFALNPACAVVTRSLSLTRTHLPILTQSLKPPIGTSNSLTLQELFGHNIFTLCSAFSVTDLCSKLVQIFPKYPNHASKAAQDL